MKRKVYTARSQRVGAWWAISVPELRGVNTQARRLEQAEAMARDAIALYLDVEANSFDLRLDPILPGDLSKKVGRAKQARAEADTMQRQAIAQSASVARELVRDAHFTVRDAGRVMGVSHQRVTQLLQEHGDRGRAAVGAVGARQPR